MFNKAFFMALALSYTFMNSKALELFSCLENTDGSFTLRASPSKLFKLKKFEINQ